MIVNYLSREAKVWLGERFVIKVPRFVGSGSTVKIWTNLDGSDADPIATYAMPSSSDLYIDLTDYVRVHTYSLETIYTKRGSVTNTMTFTAMGLIDPKSVLIPQPVGELRTNGGVLIGPPSRMISPRDLDPNEEGESSIIFELRKVDENATVYMSEYVNGILIVSSELEEPICELASNNIDEIVLDSDGHTQTFTIAPQECGKRYCLVEWISFTGATRRHVLEVRKAKSTVDGAYDLQGIDNEYRRVKGRVDGFDLFLDELDEYDIWYYADIINSSKVRVSFDGVNWAQVDVVEKNYTLPDGDAEKNGNIQISVNWKRYDACDIDMTSFYA